MGQTIPVESIAEQVASSVRSSVGIAFATSQQLLPRLFQPVHIVMCLGRPLEFRVLTYGFVAETELEVQSSGSYVGSVTPFMARLLSPKLGGTDAGMSHFRYAAWVAQEGSSTLCMMRDLPLLRSAIDSAEWSQLF